ncbi:PleD family two-component system response regulator [Acaryochloris sp. IP29b_bin.148]|uniref:GGDEF domain-containing response regulator n=1 Tax=Acaryochloris sp. IP29b_bin.148 TaxID=2969218 RepID=UPI00262B54B1|nr:PleD family two-component system response regulator [Acaryochloris sp. IP29b_bin.148]
MQEINTQSLPLADVSRSASPIGANPDRPVILIAEDDRMTRAMISHILANDGYRVIEAEDGETCLAAYQKTPPNLVLLDAMMPGMNGFECCSQIMKLPDSIYTPILMITGLEDQTSVDWAFDAGASDYITKPIHWPVLRQRVRIQLERTQLYRELEEANQKLTHLASIDELTQLPNRRVFSETLHREWRRLSREKQNLSLILADIDCFKAYNDTYGHLFGDNCLFQVASTIRQCVKRPADIPARYGGEEFAVILPNTPLEGAVHVAKGIRRAIHTLAIPHKNSLNSPHITLSLGVASVVPDVQSMGSETLLILAADKALYQAKTEGRDCIRCDHTLSSGSVDPSVSESSVKPE